MSFALRCFALLCISMLCVALESLTIPRISTHRMPIRRLLCSDLQCGAFRCVALHLSFTPVNTLYEDVNGGFALHCEALLCLALRFDAIEFYPS
ncbi:hypothetical protein [Listonella phage phiHSIC]|uniref:hypothetical protein n=1 Tax=Listonella phage phiHSIC TaxID=310539 RepID=UPI00004C740E|nr:hypothetical protein LPPPVgp21 [Listonella phage phiHSIC]AAW67518.1 hypothetical protein [Listonella phage phiHSIC]